MTNDRNRTRDEVVKKLRESPDLFGDFMYAISNRDIQAASQLGKQFGMTDDEVKTCLMDTSAFAMLGSDVRW